MLNRGKVCEKGTKWHWPLEKENVQELRDESVRQKDIIRMVILLAFAYLSGSIRFEITINELHEYYKFCAYVLA